MRDYHIDNPGGSYGRDIKRVSCPLCDSLYVAGARCTKCFAPPEVIESIRSRTRPPKFVGLLGPSGSGKTVFLGMLLDLLSRGSDGMHGLARGSFSMAAQKNLMLSLERQRFPEKTPSETDQWQWAHCEIRPTKKAPGFDLVTPDIAGEAVASELAAPGSHATVRSLIGKCSALITLVDLHEVVTRGQGQEFFAMQLVSYLCSYRKSNKRGRKVDIPLAIVFTKADMCQEAIDDAEGFARLNTGSLYQQSRAELSNVSFFASSVAGSTATVVDGEGYSQLVPLRIEPRGFVEPLAWISSLLR
jgi:energy-coupling factor transporter ATP-binding protein EcfA2